MTNTTYRELVGARRSILSQIDEDIGGRDFTRLQYSDARSEASRAKVRNDTLIDEWHGIGPKWHEHRTVGARLLIEIGQIQRAHNELLFSADTQHWREVCLIHNHKRRENIARWIHDQAQIDRGLAHLLVNPNEWYLLLTVTAKSVTGSVTLMLTVKLNSPLYKTGSATENEPRYTLPRSKLELVGSALIGMPNDFM